MEKALVRRPAVPGDLHRDTAGTYHGSALTAREQAERSTIQVDL